MVTFKEASQRDVNDVYQFRYKIYVEEMKRNQKYADHKLKRVMTPLDTTAINLIARKDDEIVGAVRLNLRKDGDCIYYRNLYDIDKINGVTLKNSSYSTGLMIDKKYRNSLLPVRLCLRAVQIYLDNNIQYNFIDCNEHLAHFFKRFGYKEYIGRVYHKEYGWVFPMVIDYCDTDYLRSIKSPFLKAYSASAFSQPLQDRCEVLF